MIEPTYDELYSFVSTAASKGWIGSTSGNAILSTLRRVKDTMELGEAADVTTLDIESLVRRFSNLNRGVGASSLASYKSRIASAIKMFTQYRADPTRWKPRSSGGVGNATKKSESPGKTRGGRPSDEEGTGSSPIAADGSLSYPFLLRGGVVVQLSGLPTDLNQADVDRITRFLRVLCVD